MPDTKTIQLILMLTELLVGFSLLVALRGNYRNGVGLWIASHFLHFIGLSLLAVREALPPAIYVAGYFFFTTATYSLGLAAFSRFLKQPCHPALIYLPPLLAPLAFQPFAHDPGMRVLVSGLFYSCQHVLIFRLIWNARGEQFGASRVLALAGYGVIIGLYLIRTILAAYYPRTVADPGFWVQPATLLVAFSMVIVLSFAFLLMIRDALDFENRRLATIDPLTDTLNRRTFDSFVGIEIERARRNQRPYALMMIDIDHFKQLNDRHGHQAGDQALVEFAKTAKSCLRQGDLMGRYGGEEFCLLLPETTEEDARVIGERVRIAAEAMRLAWKESQLQLTVSVGIAVGAESGGSLVDLIAAADGAMYRAKREGRNRVCLTTPDQV